MYVYTLYLGGGLLEFFVLLHRESSLSSVRGLIKMADTPEGSSAFPGFSNQVRHYQYIAAMCTLLLTTFLIALT